MLFWCPLIFRISQIFLINLFYDKRQILLPFRRNQELIQKETDTPTDMLTYWLTKPRGWVREKLNALISRDLNPNGTTCYCAPLVVADSKTVFLFKIGPILARPKEHKNRWFQSGNHIILLLLLLIFLFSQFEFYTPGEEEEVMPLRESQLYLEDWIGGWHTVQNVHIVNTIHTVYTVHTVHTVHTVRTVHCTHCTQNTLYSVLCKQL